MPHDGSEDPALLIVVAKQPPPVLAWLLLGRRYSMALWRRRSDPILLMRTIASVGLLGHRWYQKSQRTAQMLPRWAWVLLMQCLSEPIPAVAGIFVLIREIDTALDREVLRFLFHGHWTMWLMHIYHQSPTLLPNWHHYYFTRIAGPSVPVAVATEQPKQGTAPALVAVASEQPKQVTAPALVAAATQQSKQDTAPALPVKEEFRWALLVSHFWRTLTDPLLATAWVLYYLCIRSVFKWQLPDRSDFSRCLRMMIATSFAGLTPYAAGFIQPSSTNKFVNTVPRAHALRMLLSWLGHIPAVILHQQDTQLIRLLASVGTVTACISCLEVHLQLPVRRVLAVVLPVWFNKTMYVRKIL